MKPLLREIWRSDRRGFLTILGWNILVSLLGGIGIDADSAAQSA